MKIKANPIVKILSLVVMIAVAGLGLSHCNDKKKDEPLRQVPMVKGADGDSTADTVRALTQSVNTVKEQNNDLRKSLSEKEQTIVTLRRDNEETKRLVGEQVKQQLSDVESAPLSDINSKIDRLAGVMERLVPGTQAQINSEPATDKGGDVPAGLGFESGNMSPDPSTALPVGNGIEPGLTPAAGEIKWIKPVSFSSPTPTTKPRDQPAVLDTAPMDEKSSEPLALQAEVLPVDGVGGVAKSSASAASQSKEGIEPYFTVPENAVLMNSTAMTALIGRTPVNGSVRDPMEFKALIGRTNLAANGLMVPNDVIGMIVAGTAIGDWMLSCVEGHIYSVTFLFQDGTIRTISKRGAGVATGSGGNNASRLGFITDERGAPCINGLRITNAPAYLTQTVGMKTLEAAARYAAASQVSTSNNALGSTSAVTGDKGTFIAGQAAADGVDEVSNWLLRRLNDSFDAIYVKPGLKVAVHINQELALDKEPTSRRLNYGKANGMRTGFRQPRARLD